MMRHSKNSKREAKTFRLKPSVTDIIDSRSKLLDMSKGEYIEYAILKESTPNIEYDPFIDELHDSVETLKENIESLYANVESKKTINRATLVEIDEERFNEWFTIAVHTLKTTPKDSTELLFTLIDEGIREFRLSKYGVSILENAYNKNLPVVDRE